MNKIREALDRIERWSRWTELSEKGIESVVLFDILRDGLDYDENTAVSQCPAGTKAHVTGRADVVIKRNQQDSKTWIVLELKKPEASLATTRTLTAALRQAGKYVISYGARYGLVANHKDWIFFQTQRKAKNTKHVHQAQVLLWLKPGTARTKELKRLHSKTLEACLARCRHGTVPEFLDMLTWLNQIGEKKFDEIADTTSGRELPQAVQRQLRAALNRGDARVLAKIVTRRRLFDDCIGWKHEPIPFEAKVL